MDTTTGFTIGLILLILIFSFFPSPTPEERRAKEERDLKEAIKSDKFHQTLDDVLKDFRTPKPSPKVDPARVALAQKAIQLREYMTMKRAYLLSPIWSRKRKKSLARDGYTCQSCGQSGISLEIHHWKGYDQIPNEGIRCLVSLCRSCHQEEHDIHGYPEGYDGYMKWNHPITKGK